MSDAIVLDSGEMVDIARADAPALRRAAAEMRRRASAAPNYLPMLERDNPPPSAPRYDMDTLMARRIDDPVSVEEENAAFRTAQARGQIMRALEQERREAEKAQANTRTQLKERAGALGKLMRI